jgi:hypothetical protein
MGSFIRLSGGMTAVALAGAALTAALPATAGAAPVVQIPCFTGALVTAINNANSTSGGATIALPANCNYDITTPVTATDGLPLITGRVSLVGAQNTAIRRRAAALFRIFDVAAGGTLTLKDISVQDGRTAGLGGGIQNAGTIVLDQIAFSHNRAGNGGAVSNTAGASARISDSVMDSNATTGVGGGAIINSGSLTVTGSVMSRNTAPINGGGLNTQTAGTSRLFNDTLTRNTSGGLGGGISNLGTTSLFGTRVVLNTGSSGGGIATGNSNVTLRGGTVVRNNNPNNCSPLNTIPGCVN